MLTFLRSKAWLLVSEAPTSGGIHEGVSSSRLGGVSPSFVEVVRWEAVFPVKHHGLRVSEAACVGSASGVAV